MISFSVLGEVAARGGSWQAALQPQQQLLLAILVMERGKPVSRAGLTRLLWGEEDDSRTGREKALKRAVSDLRTALRPGSAGPDPVPLRGDTYRLVLDEQQADVLRFRTAVSEARRASGREACELMKAALAEWGPDAAGLFGGHPLSGLRGRWAEANRDTLRAEYRDARYHCLWQDFLDRRFAELTSECRDLADEPDALRDEKFLELWMVATYHAGHHAEVERIYRRARDQADVTLSGRIDRLAEIIRTEDPQLGDPDEQFEADLRRLSSVFLRPAPVQGRQVNDGEVTVAPGAGQPCSQGDEDAGPEQGGGLAHHAAAGASGVPSVSIGTVSGNGPVTVVTGGHFRDFHIAAPRSATRQHDSDAAGAP